MVYFVNTKIMCSIRHKGKTCHQYLIKKKPLCNVRTPEKLVELCDGRDRKIGGCDRIPRYCVMTLYTAQGKGCRIGQKKKPPHLRKS